jgi:anti-anti-sigma factor
VQVERAADGVVVLHVSGELDTTSAQELARPLRANLVEGIRAVVVDLTGVRFLGSAGLEALVIGQQRATELDVEFVVVATSRATVRPIEATGLNSVFTIVDSVDAAVRRYSA